MTIAHRCIQQHWQNVFNAADRAGLSLDDAIARADAAVRADMDAAAAAFTACALCGQHITDGKPCGCGAR
jgi:hypothetical protein